MGRLPSPKFLEAPTNPVKLRQSGPQTTDDQRAEGASVPVMRHRQRINLTLSPKALIALADMSQGICSQSQMVENLIFAEVDRDNQRKV